MKELCNCGKIAVWVYLPYTDNEFNHYYCDNCVNRGCGCNYNHISEFGEPIGVEDIDWKWVKDIKDIWVELDEFGNEYPCCEYDYDEDGFEKE